MSFPRRGFPADLYPDFVLPKLRFPSQRPFLRKRRAPEHDSRVRCRVADHFLLDDLQSSAGSGWVASRAPMIQISVF